MFVMVAASGQVIQEVDPRPSQKCKKFIGENTHEIYRGEEAGEGCKIPIMMQVLHLGKEWEKEGGLGRNSQKAAQH